MCGTIEYIRNKDANEIILDELERLEYRGYESTCIGIISNKILIKMISVL